MAGEPIFWHGTAKAETEVEEDDAIEVPETIGRRYLFFWNVPNDAEIGITEWDEDAEEGEEVGDDYLLMMSGTYGGDPSSDVLSAVNPGTKIVVVVEEIEDDVENVTLGFVDE